MREARFLFTGMLSVVAALALAGCMRHRPAYVSIDPATGQPVAMVTQQQFTQPDYDLQGYGNGEPQYAQNAYPPPRPRSPSVIQYRPTERGTAQQRMAQYDAQVEARAAAQGRAQERTQERTQERAQEFAQGGPYVAPPYSYAYAPAAEEQPYTLDSGDKLRVIVFGQDGISNSYTVDASGNISLPLIGSVPARGITTPRLAKEITARLKQGYVREPHVSVEVETYRPFFILGEVTTPGQYPYVANMTAETAVAIAGGFAPRAYKKTVKVTRKAPGQQVQGDVPLDYPIRPGDTVMVKERWF